MIRLINLDCLSLIIEYLKIIDLKNLKIKNNKIISRYIKKHNTTIYQASNYGYLEMIKYFFKIGKINKTDFHCMHIATFNGHFKIVKYLHKNIHIDCTLNDILTSIKYGYLDIVKYFYKIAKFKFSKYHIVTASNYGHLHIVKFLYKVLYVKSIISKLYINIIHRFFIQNMNLKLVMLAAISYDHLDIVEYLYKVAKVKCKSHFMQIAFYNGNLDMLKFLHEVAKVKCPNNIMDTTYNLFSLNKEENILKMIQYLHQVVKIKFSINIISRAFDYNHLKIVDYIKSCQKNKY